MKIKHIIKDSVFVCVGYVDENTLKTLPFYLKQNKFLLDLFDKVIGVFNGDYKFCVEARKLFYDIRFPKTIINFSFLPINRGHTYGTLDLDNEAIRMGQMHGKKYIFKSTFDIIFTPEFLEIEIPDVDFYYMNGIGYSTISQNSFEDCLSNHFFPQTNFYIINSDIDYMNEEKEIDEVWELQKQYPNKKPWELKQGFECETFLKRCVFRNNLSVHHLIPEQNYIDLMAFIKTNQIHDSSHKNILINSVGVCHAHYPNHNIIAL